MSGRISFQSSPVSDALHGTTPWKPSDEFLRSGDSTVPISILSRESYVNNNDASLLRSTTYEAKYVQPAPLLRGSLYIQDPNDFPYSNDNVDLSKMTLSHLYSTTYLPFVQKRKRRLELEFALPPAPPDFDGEAPTEPERVMQYVNGLATAYRNEVDTPSPFELYEHLITGLLEKCAPGVPSSSAENRDSFLNLEQSPLPSLNDEDTSGVALTSRFQVFDPETEVVALTISAWFSDIHKVKNFGSAFQKIQQSSSAVRGLSASVVKMSLEACKEYVMKSDISLERKCEVCSLLGLVVLPRSEIQEIFDYVDILESCSSLTSSSILPSVLPGYEEVLRSFTLTSPTQYINSAPVDASLGHTTKLPLMLSEGMNVFSFCVSPCGRLLAAATASGILVSETSTGKLVSFSGDAEMAKSCWMLQFSSQSTRIVLSTKTGLRHLILSSSLEYLGEQTTEHPSIPSRIAEETMDFYLSPRLPSGRKSSLFLVSCDNAVTEKISLNNEKTIESFLICTHLHSDFVGNIVILEAVDDVFVLNVEGGIVTLSQGSHTCFGTFSKRTSWHFLYAKWYKGTWTLGIDNTLIELRGARSCQPKPTRITGATILNGTGHIASLVVWAGDNLDSRALKKFSMERIWDSTPKPLIYLPLDEGEGLWVKEMVSMRALCLVEQSFVWDETIFSPWTPSESLDHHVHLPHHLLLQSEIMVSDYQLIIALPSAHKGGDGIVLTVKKGSNTIHRVYRCPGTHTQTLYFLSRDETYLYTFQQRFSTFSIIEISTVPRREDRLQQSGILPKDALLGSPKWMCNEILKRICINGVDLLRIPPEISPMKVETLRYLAIALRAARPTSNHVKLTALMTLAQVHFERFVTEDVELLSQIAASLNRSCKQIMEWFPESHIRDVAATLFRAGASQCLTLADKIDILIHADDVKTAEMLDSCMTKDSLYVILSSIIHDNATKILQVAKSLLQRCKSEQSRDYTGRTITHLMLWFSIISIQLLHTHGHDTVISSFFDLYLQHVKELLSVDAWNTNLQHTVIHTGFLPLLICVTSLCPFVVTPRLEEELHALLDSIPKDGMDLEEVNFSTKQACDVVPAAEYASWKFILDYNKATTVSITKEMSSSSEVTVITSDLKAPKPTKVVLNSEISFVKLPGSTLIFFGTGDNSLTTVCSYSFDVRTSWCFLMQESILTLLLAVARYLTVKPKPCDVFLAPLLRHGLDTKTLAAHDLDVPNRFNELTFAVDILNNIGDGEKYVDEVWKSMRRSVTATMRPAIQALLSILIHSGLNCQQAEDELKLRWFSGEWGSKLQGAGKDSARQSLVDLAKWITSSVFYQDSPSTLYARRSSLRTPLESPTAASRSATEWRASTSSTRRSTVRGNMQNQDTLDQVRALFTKGITPKELEEILVERTKAALSTARGLQLLATLLSKLDSRDTCVVHGVLEVLWPLCGEGSGKHMVEGIVGAGTELEMNVRAAFHSVLERCEFLLLSNYPKDMSPHTVLTYPAQNGNSTMLLLAIICHPWDAVDSDFFRYRNEDNTPSILSHLEDQMKVPTYNLTLTSPWRRRRDQDSTANSSEDRIAWNELIGAAENSSINCILPNTFSVCIPNLQISTTGEGISVEKIVSGSLLLRADDSWPMAWPAMAWFSGVPRVFYYEVTLTSSCYRLALCLCQCRSGLERNLDVIYFYENTGSTHDVSCPSFEEGDTIGCGVIATTRQIFFTLNGVFISFMGTVHDRMDLLFPTIRIENRERTSFTVNFGSSSFCYDFRRLHPALCINKGPTWYSVASTAEVVLHYITTRACAMQDSRRQGAKSFLLKCCEIVCRGINKVTSSVMNVGVGKTEGSDSRVQQAVVLSVAESSIMNFISTLRHIMRAAGQLYHLPGAVSEMVFNAVSVLMLIPMHSIQMSTISLLPEVIPHFRRVREASASAALVKALFEHAKVPLDTRGKIPFIPQWVQCDSRCISITHVQVAHMQPDAQRSIVLGNILPRTGKVSFTVRIFRRGMSKGHSLKGGYYIGIAVANLAPLSPTSNSQSWKAIKPPVVWALHDISPQLPHATNPTVKPNNFHRTFGSADVISVVLNREKQTVSFYRDDEFLKSLFTEIPSNIDLVPFVQLYNDDASAFIGSGEMTAPISSSTLLGAASVDVLRCMLTLDPFERLVADGLCDELDNGSFPSVTLALFKSTPDPRVLQLDNTRSGEEIFVTVRRLTQWRVKFSVGNVAYYEHASNLRTAAFPVMNGTFSVNGDTASLSGVKRCINSLVTAFCRLVIPLITTQALCIVETQERRCILEEERDHWDYIFHGERLGQFLTIQRSSRNLPLLESYRIPDDYVFSSALSHPCFEFSPRHCGRLATVPSGAYNTATPFIAIAEPAVPQKGKFNLRCQLLRGHNGQILGGGYYFGVCAPSFDWKRRDLNSGTPEVWAIHDMDDAPWRLRHLHSATRFNTTAEPSCIIVSGDVVRLEMDREECTMHAYRKGANQEEIHLGLIFDNIPRDIELFPFVHLYNTDAVAVLLPSEGDELAIRTTVQQPHFALCFSNEKRNCDGCVSQHLETRLNSQTWYKCNECVDYNLCKSCFALCMHSHHSFTEMGRKALVYCSAPPTHVETGMNVLIPGTSSMYLKSSGCRMAEKHINCIAESKDNNALAIWGLVFQRKVIFTVTIDTISGEPLSLDRPMFIGVGESMDVISLSTDALRSRCISGDAKLLSICSDSSMGRKLNSPSLSPSGFQRGSTVKIEIDILASTAVIKRDWVTLGTLPYTMSNSGKYSSLVGFVIFGRKGVLASIYPEENHTLPAVVENIQGGILRVSSGGRVRLITPENCRIPLAPCQTPPDVETLGYVFLNRELVQCQVISVEKDEAALHFTADDVVRRFPYTQFLTANSNTIAPERLLHREVGETGATMSEGFVMSRILLIISCLCENETLLPIVMSHKLDMLHILRQLSAVEICNDAPIEFLQEVRKAVATTCNCIRIITGGSRLGGFMPSLTINSHKREAKPNMLMSAIQGPHYGKVFRVIKMESMGCFSGLNLHGHSKVELVNTTDCIPMKQCDSKPWWELPNGLPCSLLEHTIRVTQAGDGAFNVTLEGEWQGEITLPKRGNGFISLKLKANCTGVATVVFPTHSIECHVFGEYVRYSKTVRLCLYHKLYPQCGALCKSTGSDSPISFDLAVDQLEKNISSEDDTNNSVIIMDGTIDAEGQRIIGSWKPKNDRAGTFAINSFHRIPFISPSTELAHVEPFPECKDAAIPTPPQRDMESTMHRLVVLLARHLYLVLLSKGGVVSGDVVYDIIHYHAHPLTYRLISMYVDGEQLRRTLYETLHIIVQPHTKPWDSTTLSLLITKCVVLRSDITTKFPSLLWDSFHAVVTATHQCGAEYRHHLLKNVIHFIERNPNGFDTIYTQLLSALLTWVDRSVCTFLTSSEMRKDVAAGVELVLSVDKLPISRTIRHIPLAPLQCLVDMANSFQEELPLPITVDCVGEEIMMRKVPPVETVCTFGEFVSGILKVGKIMSSCTTGIYGKYYYEATLPERLTAPFVIGWGTEQHTEVPSQHVGSDTYSFAFTGNEISSKSSKEEYKPGQEVTSGSVIGCLLDMDERLVAWSANGAYGPFVPIPIDYGDQGLYAFASTGTCSGMKISLDASQFGYVPDGYSDLSGRHTRVVIASFDASQRSVLPYRPISFYIQLSSYLSDLEEAVTMKTSTNNSSFSAFSSISSEPPDVTLLKRYPSIAQINFEERRSYIQVIRVTESCMATARRFIDLDSDVVDGRLSMAFLLMKQIVRRSFGRKLLISIPPIEKNLNPSSITVRVTELYSTLPRSPEVALQHSILSQIYKQIGSFSDKQLGQSPLFKVHLYITGTGHAPQDLGGPYRQLWTFLCDEIMAHPDKCYPHSDYHRNPLCRYLNNSQRVALVPDSSANSAYDIVLFNFLGKLMGYSARSRNPLALDFSPFLWKFLVEDRLTVKDYYKYVDSVVEKSMGDTDFFLSGMAEEIIPNLSEKISSLLYDDECEREAAANEYRRLAENCLVHSMDIQLNAIREGLWTVLPKRVIRCLSWRELELLVCGDSNLTMDQMRNSIETVLQPPREQAFWRIVEELTVEQRSSFLCFACGQKRLPLIKKVKVTENSESTEHLPRAQSCSALVTIPLYDTYELFKEKLLFALAHEMEMELA